MFKQLKFIGFLSFCNFKLILFKFETERAQYNYYMNNLNEIDKALALGTEKARNVANGVLNRVREKLGFL